MIIDPESICAAARRIVLEVGDPEASPDNENEISALASMARDEVKQLEAGLIDGKAMNLDCGI